jgi:hypothetical protein
MKKLVLAGAVLAFAFSASTAARADFAVVRFKDGSCRAWNDGGKPLQPGWKYHWVHLKSWQMASSKKHYAMAHHWCKSFNW